MKLAQLSTIDAWQCPCCRAWVPNPRSRRRAAQLKHIRSEHPNDWSRVYRRSEGDQDK